MAYFATRDEPQSSNAFASGANQNSGNVITNRPTTRVNAHGQSSGGGTSQWSIGGFSGAPANAAQSSNSFASGSNQNSGNVLTDKPSTRVNAHGQSSGGGTSQWSIGGFSGAPANAAQSSNSFASGSNQNSGNVLTDKPSTRVVREPGGASQWSIGGFSDAPANAAQSSNSFASGSNQNSGNVLTDKPSTRVVCEPGGGSQWSVGGFAQEPSVMETAAAAAANDSSPTSSKSLAEFVTSSSTSSDYGQHIFGAHSSNGSSNAFANGSNQNVGNGITNRPSTKVRQAPGGSSTIVFG